MAAFVNFPEKQSKRDIVGYIALNPRHLAGGFVEPDHSFHFRKNRRSPRRRLISRIRVHAELQKLAVAAHFLAEQRKEKCRARLVDQFGALFLLFRHSFVGLPLWFSALRRPRQ